MNRITAVFGLVLAALVVAAMPARSTSKGDAALANGALAQVYADKCKSMKVNWFTYANMLEDTGLDTDSMKSGPGLQKIVDHMLRAGQQLKGLSESEICRRAQAAFGVKGDVVPGLLSDGMAVGGMNKVFDWLHKKGF